MGTAKGTFPFNFVNPESTSTVTVSGNTLAGAQAGDYVLATNEESGLTAHITAKTLYVTGLAASNKTYDGTTTATLTGTAALLSADAAGASTTDGHPYQGDVVSLAATAGADFTGTFASPNAANGIGVAVTGGQLTRRPYRRLRASQHRRGEWRREGQHHGRAGDGEHHQRSDQDLRRHHNCHPDGGELQRTLRYDRQRQLSRW